MWIDRFKNPSENTKKPMSSITRDLEKQGRRDFLRNFGTSMAGISLSGIFPGDQVFGAAPASALVNPLAPRPSHFPSKAKACISTAV